MLSSLRGRWGVERKLQLRSGLGWIERDKRRRSGLGRDPPKAGHVIVFGPSWRCIKSFRIAVFSPTHNGLFASPKPRRPLSSYRPMRPSGNRKGDWPLPHKLPLIGGHEGVGEIVAIGAHTINSPVKIGDRVGVKWLADSCLQCEQCRKGLEQSPLPLPVPVMTLIHSNNLKAVPRRNLADTP